MFEIQSSPYANFRIFTHPTILFCAHIFFSFNIQTTREYNNNVEIFFTSSRSLWVEDKRHRKTLLGCFAYKLDKCGHRHRHRSVVVGTRRGVTSEAFWDIPQSFSYWYTHVNIKERCYFNEKFFASFPVVFGSKNRVG